MEKLKLFACVLALGAILNACSSQTQTGTDDTITGGEMTPEDPANEDGNGPDIAEENPDQGKPGLNPGGLDNLGDPLAEDGLDLAHICELHPELCDGVQEAKPKLPDRQVNPELIVQF